MLFYDVLQIVGSKKLIQVYTKDREPETKTQKEWLEKSALASRAVWKVKDRPTDPYVYIELEK